MTEGAGKPARKREKGVQHRVRKRIDTLKKRVKEGHRGENFGESWKGEEGEFWRGHSAAGMSLGSELT